MISAPELLKQLNIADPWEAAGWRDLLFDDHGWFGDENREMLDEMLLAQRAMSDGICVIEIGSWLGKSTRFFCERADLVIAIDHWQGSREHQSPMHMDHKRLATLYPQFLLNCCAYRDRLVPLRMSSSEASKLPLPRANLVYIDGSHEFCDVAGDLARYLPFVDPCGVICGDDWLWEDAGGVRTVAAAVCGFAKSRSLDVDSRGNFWWLRG